MGGVCLKVVSERVQSLLGVPEEVEVDGGGAGLEHRPQTPVHVRQQSVRQSDIL